MFAPITDVELLALMIDLHDDQARRQQLAMGSSFHEAAAAAGLIGRTDQDGFARSVGQAYQRGLLIFGSTAGGSYLRPPDEGPWTDHALQSRYDYEPTPAGRELVLTQRRLRRLDSSATTHDGVPSLAEARRLLADGARVDAVIEAVEGVLGTHLRATALHKRVALKRERDGRPLGLADLNNALRKAQAYSAADHAQVQTWLHLRNEVAHRLPDGPNDRRIELLCDGIELFVAEQGSVGH